MSSLVDKKIKILKVGKNQQYLVIVVFVFTLAVLQDYIYSSVQNTGFYWSDSFLYNTFWIFFIPLTLFINQLIKRVNPNNILGKTLYNLGIGIVFSFLHLILFTLLFVFVSNLVFSPSHYFSNIFNAAFSNQFYIALLWYVIFPAIYVSFSKSEDVIVQYSEKIKLKIGSKIFTVPTSSIQFISTEKPYSMVCTNDQNFLDDKSLKEFERELDPTVFLRVHRSVILNSEYVKELKSRNNGDYDVKLISEKVIRLSRHYRNNWQQLLQ